MRWTRAAVVASALSIVLAGCGAGPSDRPGVAVERPAVGGVPTTSVAPAPPPTAQVPKTDLSWRDCTATTVDQLGLGPAPAGLVLECAEFSTPIDASGSVLGSFRAGAMRARTAQTPAGAPPLVLTSGTDRSSTATLAGMAVAGGTLLTDRPVVAVDRRGIGTSQAIDCLPPSVRRGLADNGQFGPEANQPIEAVTGYSQDGTIACRDFLQPYEGTFDAPHAADDIEQLRKQWQVEHIDLLGAGNGARVALSYARKFGDHLSRLVLDAPEPVGGDAVTKEDQRLQGAEAALKGFAQRCVGLSCSLGADPRAAVEALVDRAASGGLGDISANALLTGITGFLGAPRADQPARVTELADALSAAGRGDRAALTTLIQRESAATAADGQFVNRCTDTQQPPTPVKAQELTTTWDQKYPVFGRAAAIALMECAAWPVATAPAMPEKLALPVLVLGGVADPVVGSGGSSSVTGALGAAGATHATLTWQGWGHPVSTHSSCAQRAVVTYLKEGKLPGDGTACPA
ncbi:alpha/beta hydrolase [Nocardia bovistercoris]|uniref:Alpha/beta hydrolase n=1 Tax=Nocardia bovistercoris TaxID=2785916 RepID=A0A931I6P5_9NOCA|nr:alpha/beta hydrolase [Nocardia bovistercoris]MBH0775081.1 alpha/beta hydrolase [Nocardia bovistercoris]